MSVKRNVAAGVAGRLWAALMSFAFVPFYVRFLGVEAYGLIGLFASMMAMFAVLDMGLSTTVNRELSRQSGAGGKGRTLLRTLEWVYWLVAVGIGGVLILAAPLIANHWLSLDTLSPEEATTGIRLMGLTAMLRWPVPLYTGALMGLGRQIRLSAVTSATATLQGAGAVLVLWLVAPTVTAFFTWQAAVAAAQVAALGALSWHGLRLTGHRAAFSTAALRGVFGFAAGITGITLLSVILTQLDKLVLSRLLPLEQFGYYTLAGAIAATLNIAGGALHAAVFPAFSRAATAQNEAELRRLYHASSQLMALLVLPTAITVIAFAPELLTLYLHDPAIVANTTKLLRLLVAGNALLTLMLLPLALQLAHGWTRLSLYKNILAVLLFVPALWVMVSRFGAAGAAMVWLGLTLGYFLIEVQVMHRRLLRGAQWRWYVVDTALPALVSGIVVGAARIILVPGTQPLAGLVLIGAAGALALGLSALALPEARRTIKGLFPFRFRSAAAVGGT